MVNLHLSYSDIIINSLVHGMGICFGMTFPGAPVKGAGCSQAGRRNGNYLAAAWPTVGIIGMSRNWAPRRAVSGNHGPFGLRFPAVLVQDGPWRIPG